jgi:hypothetical protein
MRLFIAPLTIALVSLGLYASNNLRMIDARAAVQHEAQGPDAKTIQRLRLEQIAAQLAVNHWHRELRPYAMSDHPPAALLDSLGAAKVRLDLADRAVNRFMGCGSASGN